MVVKLSGAEFPLKKVFSTDFEYTIPLYQRPYAWTEDESAALFADLMDFFELNEDRDDETKESYFLGSIVLIKEEGKPKSDVVDGQQRLTTLTILLAAIAYKFQDCEQSTYIDHMKDYILEPGKPFEGVKPKPRLSLRERDRLFFEKYVQNFKFDLLQELDQNSEKLDNDSKRNIKHNSILYIKLLESTFDKNYDRLFQFASFLLSNCYIVTVSTPSAQSAFRVFSILNGRGLDLLPTDIIKADLIGNIEVENQEDYSETWENMEDQIGREEFHELFAHIRMIFAKKKAKQSLREEFLQYVMPNKPKSELIIDQVIQPFADTFRMLKSGEIQSVNDVDRINQLIRCLKRIRYSDWLPPAIQFLTINNNKTEDSLYFFSKLERLTAYLYVSGKGLNYRLERYASIIESLESPEAQVQNIESLELSEQEKVNMREILEGPIYIRLTANRRNYIILRLDAFLSDGATAFAPNILTLEHVLPLKVASGSDWEKSWPDYSKREYWVNRIANLVPLSRNRSSRAQKLDFSEKKSQYFSKRGEIPAYELTSQVLKTDSWTPNIVEERQDELLSLLFKNWEL